MGWGRVKLSRGYNRMGWLWEGVNPAQIASAGSYSPFQQQPFRSEETDCEVIKRDCSGDNPGQIGAEMVWGLAEEDLGGNCAH